MLGPSEVFGPASTSDVVGGGAEPGEGPVGTWSLQPAASEAPRKIAKTRVHFMTALLPRAGAHCFQSERAYRISSGGLAAPFLSPEADIPRFSTRPLAFATETGHAQMEPLLLQQAPCL